jgi:hypothetical protein
MNRGSIPCRGNINFSFPWPTQPPINCQELFPGSKTQRCKANRSPPSGGVVRNGGAIHPAPHVLINHGNCIIYMTFDDCENGKFERHINYKINLF